MKPWLAILPLVLTLTACTTRSNARLREQNAYLAGQNAVLLQQAQQQQAQAAIAFAGVTVVGAVQHPQVPWVTGLTLAQAIATANYVGAEPPKQIVLTRHGESATMEATVLLNGADIPLEIGDKVELR